MNAKIFRSSALEARGRGISGEIIIKSPAYASSLSLLVLTLVFTLVGMFFFAPYTKRVQVLGELVPNTGVIKIHVPQTGVILERPVGDGDHVRQGQTLYVLSSERETVSKTSALEAIGAQLEVRRSMLAKSQAVLPILQSNETKEAEEKLRLLQLERGTIQDEISLQKEKLRSSETILEKYHKLLQQGFLSADALQKTELETIEQRIKLKALLRDEIGVQHNISSVQASIRSLPIRHQEERSLATRNLAAVSQEVYEAEANRRLAISAPEEGTVSAIFASAGQTVNQNDVLATIIPARAALVAHLYVPSTSIGRLAIGDRVLLRYDTFSFQKFGQFPGVVRVISKTILDAAQLPQFLPKSLQYYRVIVILESQTIGNKVGNYPLLPGMTFSALITQDRKKIFQWIFDPLQSIYH